MSKLNILVQEFRKKQLSKICSVEKYLSEVSQTDLSSLTRRFARYRAAFLS